METNNETIDLDYLIEVEELNTDQFLKVKETLTRIGIPARIGDTKILWQSCHVLQKRGRYFIVHFKQMFQLDGKATDDDISDEDLDRVEYITSLLEEWGLVVPLCDLEKKRVNVKIIPYSQRKDWDLRSKYNIGVLKR